MKLLAVLVILDCFNFQCDIHSLTYGFELITIVEAEEGLKLQNSKIRSCFEEDGLFHCPLENLVYDTINKKILLNEIIYEDSFTVQE